MYLVSKFSVAEYPMFREAYGSAIPDPSGRVVEVALPQASSIGGDVCPMVRTIDPTVVEISLCYLLG